MNVILRVLGDVKAEKGTLAAVAIGVGLVLAVAIGLYFGVDLMAIARNMGLLGG